MYVMFSLITSFCLLTGMSWAFSCGSLYKWLLNLIFSSRKMLEHQVLTVGALHQADSAALRIAAISWHDELAPLPKPLLVVNIGGPTSKLFLINFLD